MMNLLHYIAAENVINALGWTLIHSFWQIAVIGLLLKAGLLIFRNKSAETRFTLTSVSLMATALISVITFVKNYESGAVEKFAQPLSVGYDEVLQDQSWIVQTQMIEENKSRIQRIVQQIPGFIDANLRMIVLFWLAGMLIFSFRFAGSYLYIRRLKKSGTQPATGMLFRTALQIKTRLKICKEIRLAESVLVKIPMVIGHLKPVVLMPVGLAAALPYEQVEAIIAHELAHIRRSDYLQNILKLVLQVLYFYHPVIWWISGEMEKERENCCDDITIGILGGEKSLQSALISLQQFQQKSAYVAAAFVSKKYKLLNRIKRMKTTNQIKQGFKGNLAGFIVLLGGIIVLTTSSAFSPKLDDLPGEYKTQNIGLLSNNIYQDGNKTDMEEKTILSGSALEMVTVTEPDSVKSEKQNSPEEKARVTLELDGNYNLISVKKDGKPLEGEEKSEYEAMAEKLKKINEEESERENQRIALEQAEKQLQAAQEQIEKARLEYEKAMEAYNGNLLDIDEEMNKVMVWTEEDSDNFKNAMKEIRVITDVGVGETPRAYSFSFDDHDFVELPEDCLHEKEVVAAISANKLKHLDDLDREIKMIEIEKELDSHGDSKKIIIKHSGSDNLLETLRKELVSDGILKDNDEKMNFSLTQDEVEVNGQKLSDDLHKKYLKIYSKETGNKLNGEFKIVIKN